MSLATWKPRLNDNKPYNRVATELGNLEKVREIHKYRKVREFHEDFCKNKNIWSLWEKIPFFNYFVQLFLCP